MSTWRRTVRECRRSSKVPVYGERVAFAMPETAGEVGVVVVEWAAFATPGIAEVALAAVVGRVERVRLEEKRWGRLCLA